MPLIKRDRESGPESHLYFTALFVDFFISLLAVFNTNEKGLILDTAREVIGL